MSKRLLTCRSCGRHVLTTEPKCPFCQTLGPARAIASAVTLGASLSLLACERDVKTTTPASTDPAAVDASTAAEARDAAATPGAATPPGDDAGSGLGFGGLDLGAIAAQDAARDGGIYLGRLSTGVYGPAQPRTDLGPTAIVTVSKSSSTVPLPNADATMNRLAPRVKALCTMALRTDPTAAGTLDVTVTVAPDGTVTDADVKPNGLPPSVASSLRGVLLRTTFDAPGKQAKVTGKYTCKPAT